MTGIFTMAGLVAANMTEHKDTTRAGANASARITNLQANIKMLENNLAKALLINEALWELIKEKHSLTEEDLNEKLYTIDMRDGQLDGKNQRSAPTRCPNCQRMVSARHAACLYCGSVLDESVFRMS